MNLPGYDNWKTTDTVSEEEHVRQEAREFHQEACDDIEEYLNSDVVGPPTIGEYEWIQTCNRVIEATRHYI